jgi:hypothetical protein
MMDSMLGSTYMMNPTSIKHRKPTIKGLRLPTLSEIYATTTARMAAVMYMGTVMSCAVLEL